MSYVPEFEGPIEGYVVNFLKKHLWRIAPTHERDDAMQEARLVFLRCAAKYPLLENGAHFMALFKTAWSRRMVDLAFAASDARNEVSSSVVDRDDVGFSFGTREMEMAGDLDNDGHLSMLIQEAPTEVMMVLNLFLNAPRELLELATSAWKKGGRYKPDGDRAVAKMLGLPEDSEPMTKTKKYFS